MPDPPSGKVGKVPPPCPTVAVVCADDELRSRPAATSHQDAPRKGASVVYEVDVGAVLRWLVVIGAEADCSVPVRGRPVARLRVGVEC
jgi:hypothetical protein